MKKFIIVFFALALLPGCSDDWGWYVVNPYNKSGLINVKFLLSGYYFTLLLSFTSILISVVVGLLVALPGVVQKPVASQF